jgi:hypothetical protein
VRNRRALPRRQERKPQATASRGEAPRRAPRPAAKKTYNSIGSAAVAAKTGKGWHDWFAILDRAKANTWPHKQIASFLYDEQSVPGWWCQMITVGYEQARGLRVKHQKADGFAASASKTIEAPVEKLFDAWNEEASRRGLARQRSPHDPQEHAARNRCVSPGETARRLR